MSEQAVLVFIKLVAGPFGGPDQRAAIQTLEERLENAVDENDIGEFDGNDIGEGFWRLYTYGPSADRLLEVMLPILRAEHTPLGSYVVKRYGGPGATERRLSL